jgi:hypothetical protein
MRPRGHLWDNNSYHVLTAADAFFLAQPAKLTHRANCELTPQSIVRCPTPRSIGRMKLEDRAVDAISGSHWNAGFSAESSSSETTLGGGLRPHPKCKTETAPRHSAAIIPHRVRPAISVRLPARPGGAITVVGAEVPRRSADVRKGQDR